MKKTFAVQPGVAQAFALCSSVASLSFLAFRSITQPTDDPVEKLCSALNSCWTPVGLKQKGRFRMVRHIRSWSLPLLAAFRMVRHIRSWLLPLLAAFRMVRHIRSWLLPLLAACPSVSQDPLLAVRRRVSSCLCTVYASLSTPVGDRRVRFAGGLRPYFHCDFSQKRKRSSWSWAPKKRRGSFLAWAGGQLQKACSSYWQRMWVSWETIDTWMVGFWSSFAQQIIETNRPMKVG